MKIIVNKEATQNSILDEANRVVEEAKQKAQSGISSFNYSYPRGIDGSSVISKVKELTEGTVVCSYRGHDGNSRIIKFCIVEVK